MGVQYTVQRIPGPGRTLAVVALGRIGASTHVFTGIVQTKADWDQFRDWVHRTEAKQHATLLMLP